MGATIKSYVYGTIMFSFIILGLVTIMSNFFGNKVTLSQDSDEYARFNSTFNTFDSINAGTNQLQQSMQQSPSQKGSFGFLDSLISSAWNTLTNVFTSFSAITNMLSSLSSYFGIPTWVGGTLISLIVAVISFSIYSAIFRVTW